MIDLNTFTYYVGIFVTLKFVLVSIVYGFYNLLRIHLFSKIGSPIKLKSRYGPWAVVTGCTDGIGLAYSKELAKRGLNIVLISRSLQKLENVAEQIKSEFTVETRIIQADFAKEGRELYSRIAENLKHITIGILVNNVGVSVPYPMKLEEMSQDNVWEHLSVNVTPAAMLAHMVLPDMKVRRKGAIVNVASLSGFAVFPYINVYTATKNFMVSFSQGLNLECEGSGVTVQTLFPAYTETNMTRDMLEYTLYKIPTAETYARHAIATLGVTDFTAGYFRHDIEYWMMSHLPASVVTRLHTDYMKKVHDECLKNQ